MDDETRHHWSLITTPTGIEWSGRTRYAAAMYFFQQGEMSAEVLEVYRISSRLDAEDPLDVLRRWKMGSEWIARVEAWRAHDGNAGDGSA
ncbi:hypothetical protein [Sinorhizobium sp. BG8]|uniref:hypothetical protein n=1 Tax=Sinorhizobium sp. BG8 TaxID=2613773 RepID=UPI00193D49FA|nr:hypothetical protein [Sinorhizobium sp. BG8]QRM55945.1 hypothetical protein F3Y30_16485 [Sinorhizobium sp. BG8]